MPSTDILRRAMELWGIELTYRGRTLTFRDLESPVPPLAAEGQPIEQLSLWDSIKRLEDDALSVQIEKKGPQSIVLRVDIGFNGERSQRVS
jgi:hypothetical protein